MLEDQLGLVHGWLMSVPCKVSVQGTTCTAVKHATAHDSPMVAVWTWSVLHKFPSASHYHQVSGADRHSHIP